MDLVSHGRIAATAVDFILTRKITAEDKPKWAKETGFGKRMMLIIYCLLIFYVAAA